MNILSYKGFAAAVEFDADDMILIGRIAGINDVIGFHGDRPQDLVAAFRDAVDDYLDTCAKLGKEPERTYSGKVMLRVEPEVHASIALAAQLTGRSINQLGEEALRVYVKQVLPKEVRHHKVPA
jgi:predicted HicB family RNase H-like nuclease